MATKLKNMMFKWQFKWLAQVLIVIAGTSFLWSFYQIGKNWEALNHESFFDTNEFQSNYIRLIHNALEKELVLYSEEEILNQYEESQQSEHLERLRRIQGNLERARSFRYAIVHQESGKIVTNVKGDAINLISKMPTSVQWEVGRVSFPEASELERSDFGSNAMEAPYSFGITGESIFDMLQEGPYIYLTAFDEEAVGDDVFFLQPYQSYQTARAQRVWYYSLLTGSVVMGLFILVYLSKVTGKNELGAEVRLGFLDYIPYEFQILVLMFFLLLPYEIATSIGNPDSETLGMVLMCAFLNVWVLGVIHLYLSLIRNGKRKRLWRNVMGLRVLASWIELFVQFTKSYKPWLIVVFFGISFINMIFTILIINGAFPMFVLFCLFNLLVLKYLIRYLHSIQRIMEAARERARGRIDFPLEVADLTRNFQDFAVDINSLQSGLKTALDEAMRGERMKTELITNVTHDLKNPLTSIISYVELLKQEEVGETAGKYIEVLDDKAKRLKDLITHVVEAAKASSGNVEVLKEEIDVEQLLLQVIGEYQEKFDEKQLEIIMNQQSSSTKIMSDSKVVYRIVENLLTNIYKYSMERSRVYVSLMMKEEHLHLELKNISAYALNIPPEQLVERFVRGDESRGTEGSGLGLSIAGSLADLIGAKLKVEIDGDLFKVNLGF